MAKKKRPDDYFVWCICNIDSATISMVQRELSRYPQYKQVEVFIPTVKVLRKTHKGEDQFDEVPLLFHYGFFKIPRKKASQSMFLETMKTHISCIFGWVRDPVKTQDESLIRPKKRRKLKMHPDRDIPCATATKEDIDNLIKIAFDFSIHSDNEINSIEPGSFITLRGYPFDNVQAEIIEVDAKKKKAQVKLHIIDGIRQVEVSLDNILFTVYHKSGYDDSLSNNLSLDELMANRSKRVIKKGYNEES